jgi:hypothetical protein
VVKNVCIYCGSNVGVRTEYADAARRLARHLAASGVGIVYGGASRGIMGILADEMLVAGGEVVGVIPQALKAREIAHEGLTELHVVNSMHERKAMMAERSDAFVALPGGFGTLEEFCEVLTWSQLGLHPVPKPCGLLDVAGFYRPLVDLFDRAAEEGFVRPEHRGLVLVAEAPGTMLDELEAWRPPPPTRKWVG